MNLRDARLEEIEHPDESDEDSSILVVRKHVIAIWLPLQGPTYLIIPTKQEKVCSIFITSARGFFFIFQYMRCGYETIR